MGVCSRNEPIECYRVYKSLHVFIRFAGLISNQFYNSGYPRSAIAFVLGRGMKPESLAHVLLMDARSKDSIADAVVPLYDDCDFVSEVKDL